MFSIILVFWKNRLQNSSSVEEERRNKKLNVERLQPRIYSECLAYFPVLLPSISPLLAGAHFFPNSTPFVLGALLGFCLAAVFSCQHRIVGSFNLRCCAVAVWPSTLNSFFCSYHEERGGFTRIFCFLLIAFCYYSAVC